MRLILKILIFITPILTYCLVTYAFNLARLKKVRVNLENVDTVIVGDSHLKQALNPIFIPNSINICENAEPILLSKMKLDYLFSQDSLHHIKRIILGFGYHNLTTFDDEKFINVRYSDDMYMRVLPIIDFRHLPTTDKFVKSKFYKNYMISMFFSTINSKRIQSATYGGYFNNNENRTASNNPESVIQRHYFSDKNKTWSFSFLNKELISEIINKCELNGIELILVNTPLHVDYRSRIPASFILNYDSVVDSLAIKYPNTLKVIKSDTLKLKSEMFYDYDHINALGADYYTNWFIQEYSKH